MMGSLKFYAVLVSIITTTLASIRLDIERSPGPDTQQKRSVEALNLKNTHAYYRAKLHLGSPPQPVNVQIDTGSSDLWVMSQQNPYCKQQIKCEESFMFNVQESNTFRVNGSNFIILYGDSTFAQGDYGQDKVSIGNVTVDKANFALATLANSTESVFGIGMASTEAMATHWDRKAKRVYPTYDNIPVQMKQQGIIKRISYSLWLNRANSSQGSLLFGAIDHKKYKGELQKVPIVSRYRKVSKPLDFSIMLHGVGTYKGDNMTHTKWIEEMSIPVLLDCGTTFTMLPHSVLSPMLHEIGAYYDEYLSGYISQNCNPTGGASFNLSGIEIHVPWSELLIQTGEGICILSVLPPVSEGQYILGDSFLRSVYAVYDLEGLEIALANARYDSDEEDIREITGAIPVPKASAYSATHNKASIETLTGNAVMAQTKRSLNTSGNNAGKNAPLALAMLLLMMV